MFGKERILKKTDKTYNVKYSSKTSKKVLDELDDEQRAAVLDDGGMSLIIAGPGSGKTKTITHKIAYLVSTGVSPYEILLVTFTRAASREMIHRAQQVSRNKLDGMLAGTFHHVCNYLLRKHASVLKLDPNFSILDEEDVKTLIKHARSSLISKQEKFPSLSLIRRMISLGVNLQKSLENVVEEHYSYLFPIVDRIEEIRQKYENMKLEQSALDYDDLLNYTNHLLSVENVRLEEASRFKWVLVDEFQDTNKIQFEIIKKLSSVHKNLMAVGDDAQSIYSFRGARYENIFDLSREKGVKVYKIQTNYRSSPQIVALINNVIPHNVFKKELRAIKPPSTRPVVVSTWDSFEEAEFVSSRITELVNEGIKEKEIAVLYRAHAHSMDLQLELSKLDIPFAIKSGIKFTESKHIKDVLAFLRVLNNPHDTLSWLRTLQLFTGIGRKGADTLISFIQNERDPLLAAKSISKFGKKYENVEETFKNLLKESTPGDILEYVYNSFYSDYLAMTFNDFRDRQLDIERLVEISRRYQDTTSFLSDLAITEEVDLKRDNNQESDKITLTTVHQAKGLEWDVVFVLAVNPGDFPSYMGIKSGNFEEERRVFYVAVTRARRQLYLCHQMGGSRMPIYGNRMSINSGEYDLIDAISPSLYDHWSVD